MPLAKQGQFCHSARRFVIDPLYDCCNRLRRQNGVAHPRCLTPSYAAIVCFDPVPVAANINVTGFAATLTEAVVTNNSLELVSDTFFLGDPTLGSKLFIRPCYKGLSEIILDGASSGALRNFVVTGTPGVGKSVFGWYLLYLLRCQGLTVLFERKGRWYRFSDDEGVQKGRFETFDDAGYLEDPTAWYLSDPVDRPMETFAGTTVVLVSPKAIRVNEFMKQAKSVRFYMGVWSLDELLECQRAIFRGAGRSGVQDAFRDVGGVARAVFDEDQLTLLKKKMVSAAESLKLDALRDAIQPDQPPSSTNAVGDALFKIFQDDTNGFRECKVAIAGEFAEKSVIEQVSKRGTTAIASWMAVVNSDEKLLAAVGPNVWASLFEQYAHSVIAGKPGDGGREFEIDTIIDGLGEGPLRLNFDGRREQFRGQTFPGNFNVSTYYVPKSRNFKSIDSFGVDGPTNTIYFFQMKSGYVKTVAGDKVEKYWITASELEIDGCVLVYVVPAGDKWDQATKKLRRSDGLPGASDAFKRTCRVCVMELPFDLTFVPDGRVG